MPDESDYLTTEQTAEALGYTVQHVRRLAREGRLRGRKLGRDWLIEGASVASYLQSQATQELPLERSG